MLTLALVLAALAAALHVYIFWMEAFAWETPRVRATFGTSETEAATTKAMAYNQGFYNLFLAIMTIVGVVMLATDAASSGWLLVVAGAGSMLAAAIVLVTKDLSYARAAATQGTLPLLALITLAIALAWA
ncbi:DUF1304 domain-containing protein [Demequina sp. NBRC 110051]|uniref:DUF1304 domain-containing protein n=1 Tax=Demequina sp. NBRC 110051 TaxID=1570340 RepID=UPI000A01D5F1|nr:DUF1304 domain-containing protein [Demequina sp. NBRC 110051]